MTGRLRRPRRPRQRQHVSLGDHIISAGLPLTGQRVTRRVSVRGAIMVGGQGIQVGLAHARKTVAVTVGPDTIQVAVETSITVTAARTTSRDIRRHKASNYG